jgi:hypothetical protein
MDYTKIYAAAAAARFQRGLTALKANERTGALLDFSEAGELGNNEAKLYEHILKNKMSAPKDILNCKSSSVCSEALPLLRSVAGVNPEASFVLGKILREQEKINPDQKKEGVDFIVGAALKDYEPACLECCEIASYAFANDKWKLFPYSQPSRLLASECDAIVKALVHWEPTKLAATYYLGEVLLLENNPANTTKGREYIFEAARNNYSKAFVSAGKKLLETKLGYSEGCSFLLYAVKEFADEAASNALKDFEGKPGGMGIIEKAGDSIKGFISKLKSPRSPGIKCKT